MRQISASATFASTHKDEREGPHLHGHTFIVKATELGLDTGVKYELMPDLRALLSELHLHSLDDMLTGGSQTLDGLGAWLMERLLINHPRLVAVEVSTLDAPGLLVTVTREIR